MQLSRDTKRFFLLLSAFTVALILCISHVSSIIDWLSGVFASLMPFIIGGCLAFIIGVPMRIIDKMLQKSVRKGKTVMQEKTREAISLVLAIVFLFVLLILFGSIVLPQLLDTVTSLAGSVMRFVPTAQRWITEIMTALENYPEIHDAVAPMIPDLNQLASSMLSIIQRYAGAAISSIVLNVSSFFSSATDVVISFVFAIYILMQTDSLSRQCKKMLYAFLPKAFCDDAVSIARLTYKTFFSYITIQCTEAMILGGLCFIGMLIFRFPHALVISVIMLFCALIPIYGAFISCILGAFLVLIESPMKAIGFVAFILILQQIETNLIYPRVVSTSINLPSMWVLLAVTVGGGIFGVVGMITAVPITSIVYTLLGKAANRRLIARSISPDEPLGPPPEA